jgi:integrase/recombinase XerD
MSPKPAVSKLFEPSPSIARPDDDEMLVDVWLRTHSPNTQRAYAADIARFLVRVPKPLAAVSLKDLQVFATSLTGLKHSTAARVLSAVKSLLGFGFRAGYLPSDVGRAFQVRAGRDNLAQRILPEADVHRILILAPNERNRGLLTLLYASGCRVSEVCGLKWQDLQATAEGGQITVLGKGGKTRSIQLPPSVWKQLLSLRGKAGPQDPVFRSRKKGGHLRPYAVHRIVRQVAKRAGIKEKVSPHWLRHAHASHALDRGAPIHLVQTTLGHASLATTSRYLHARPKESSSKFLAL